MFGIVGYLRTISAFALMLGTAAAAAEPAEPLTVTRLPDAEKLLVTSAVSDNTPDDADTGQFSRAITDAMRAQRQSIQANCESAPAASSPIAARWAWEARCRYKRY